MQAKTLLIGAVAAVALIAIGLALKDDGTEAAPPMSGEPLFPGFDVNAATAFEVRHADGTYRIARDGDTWGLAAKGGYPVDIGKVRELLLAVSEIEIVDRKTDDPVLLPRLGLQQEPEEGDLHWRRLDVEAGGDVAAAVVLGERPGRGRTTQAFARRADEDQAWLVEADGMRLHTDPLEWVDKAFLTVARERVRAVRVQHADGEVVTVSKQDASDDHFRYHELGERELRYASAPDGLASALQHLKLADVAPADEMELDASAATTTSFWTWDGIRVDATIVPVEDTHWATVSVAADPEGAPTPPAEEAEDATQDGADGADEEVVAEAEVTPEQRRQDVDAWSARVEGWAFELPAYNVSSLTKSAQDMVKPPPSAETGGEQSEFLAPGDTGALGPTGPAGGPLESGTQPSVDDDATEDAADAADDEPADGTADGATPPDDEDAEPDDTAEPGDTPKPDDAEDTETDDAADAGGARLR